MTTSNDPAYAYMNVAVVLKDTTTFDKYVRLDGGRFQRCTLRIGGHGFGSVTIAGTPEGLHALARQAEAAAIEADLAEAAAAVAALQAEAAR